MTQTQAVIDKMAMEPKAMINEMIGASITAGALEATGLDDYFSRSSGELLMNSLKAGAYCGVCMGGGRLARSFFPFLAVF